MKPKEHLIGATGTVSGIASVLGSWQICHNICLGIIAVLGLIGITLTGMPLLIFTKIAVPLWSVAVILLLISYILYLRKKCVSPNFLIINLGLIIAGIPFYQTMSLLYYITGGTIVVIGSVLLFKEKFSKKEHQECHHEQH